MATLVEMLLDAASNKGDFDLIADYAAAIPVEVVGNVLGVPYAEVDLCTISTWQFLAPLSPSHRHR